LKKILLIGSTGFIGKIFFSQLKKKNFDVVHEYNKKKINILDKKILEKVVTKKLDCIINLSGQISKNMKSVNIVGNKNMIDILNKKKIVLQYVYFSSSLLYKFTKKNLNENSEIFIDSEYKMAKYIAEKYITNFYKSYHILRIANVYDDNFSSNGFLKNLAKASLSDGVFKVSNSKTCRNFIHVNDVVNEALILIKKKKYGIYNVFNENFKLGQIISLFSKILKKKIYYNDLRKSLKSDNSQKFSTKEKKYIYKPKFALKKTIQRFYDKYYQ
jgi:nucleoside-diphosphate-sugar epimerase